MIYEFLSIVEGSKARFRMDSAGALTRDGQPMQLSPREREILTLLLRKDGGTVEYRDFEAALWANAETDITDAEVLNRVNALVSKLRKVVGKGTILTVRKRTVRKTQHHRQSNEQLPGGYRIGVQIEAIPDVIHVDPLNSEDLLPLVSRLGRKGILPPPDLRTNDALNVLGTQIVVGNIILDGAFRSFEGVPAENVVIKKVRKHKLSLPQYVVEAQRAMDEPAPNYSKLFLTSWQPPILDEDDKLKLDVAVSDFWTSKAIRQCIGQLQKDILSGRLDRSNLPRRLDVNCVIVTEDDKILLGRREKKLADEGGAWCIFGEQMDPDRDRDKSSGLPSPRLTVDRTLREHDEVGLSDELARTRSVTFVALATEWHLLLANLVAIVSLRATHETLRNFFMSRGQRVGEHDRFDFVDFSLNTLLDLILKPRYMVSGAEHTEARLTDIARFDLLLTLINRFGYYKVLDGLH
jgi:hypothetical protein